MFVGEDMVEGATVALLLGGFVQFVVGALICATRDKHKDDSMGCPGLAIGFSGGALVLASVTIWPLTAHVLNHLRVDWL